MPAVVALSDSFVASLPKGWDATVRIKQANGTTDATVYKDANGDATGANPLPLASAEFGRNYDGNGGWQCYLVPGDYVVSVTPHGGSEHHASVTVTAAAPPVSRGLYEVYGTPSVDVPVPTWNPTTGRLEFAAGGGGGGASEQSLPLADTAATIDTTTYDNTVSGDGKLTTVVMPASDNDGDSVVLAVAVEGDDFPRWLLLADSTDGLYIGDGSFDPYEAGSSVYTDSDGSLTINAPEGATITLQSQNGQVQVGDHDDNLGNVLSVGAAVRIDGASGIVSGTGDPSGAWGGNVGDIFIRQDGSEGSVIYRCTTEGPGGDAVWTGIL